MEPWNGKALQLQKEIKHSKTSNTIITFDIEVTSLFEYKDGWRCFRPKLSADAYAGIEKAAVPYIWMVGYESKEGYKSVYGREFYTFGDMLETLGNPNHKRVIWVFNLSYEFAFLLDIIEDRGWTIEKMLARSARKPISFYIPEINIEFRCAYMLTNLSLRKAAEQFSPVHKKTGGKDLIYTVPRSPLTDMTETELSYCENDVISLCYIIEHYRKKYGGKLRSIPLTSTGEVRKELRGIMPPADKMRIARHTPDAETYLALNKAFQGGITHSSYIHVNRVQRSNKKGMITSGDMASAYPTAICSELFPASRWLYVPPTAAGVRDREHWAVIYHVKWYGVESKLLNHYILGSKIIKWDFPFFDNGRLICADYVEMFVTSIDYDIIKRCYSIDREEIVETWISHLDYLPRALIDYTLTLYERKTALKNVAGQEELYRASKSNINSLFGCCCTNILKQSTYFEDLHWKNHPLTMDYVREKMEELRRSKTNCFSYSTGVFITAYCRRRTWSLVEALDASKLGFDHGVIYYDTDSVKARFSPTFAAAMAADNERLDARLRRMCDDLNIDVERTRPKDPDGIAHPLGHWEIDGEYREFLALGAKRYAHRDAKTNKLDITVSGVNNRTGRKALHDDIRKFTKNLVFNYKEAGKMISVYTDEQPEFTFYDKDGKPYTSKQRHGVVLQPTTYNMTIDPLFEQIWEDEIERR